MPSLYPHSLSNSIGLSRLLGLLCLLTLVFRPLFTGTPLTAEGPVVTRDALFECILFTSVVVGAHNLGLASLAPIFSPQTTSPFITATRVGLGLGALGCLTSILGFLGFYSAPWLGATLCGALIFRSGHFRVQARFKVARSKIEWGAYSLFVSLICSVFLQGFAPPVDYDALMYHLSAPKLFLQKGRIVSDESLWFTSYPMLIQSLFGLGLAFDSTPLASHLHLLFAVLTFVTTFELGCLIGGRGVGWLSVLILGGMPVIWTWASWAENDLAITYFGLASTTLLLQPAAKPRSFFPFAGMALGFALGTKYFALGLLPSLAIVAFCVERSAPSRERLLSVLHLVLPAITIGGIWYLRNWWQVGNPVFPLFFGGRNWPIGEDLWAAFMRAFGVPPTFENIWKIAILLFTETKKFSVLRVEQMHPLFAVLPGAIFIRQKPARLIFVVLAGLYGTWAFGSQQFRFLAPLFPYMAILSAVVVDRCGRLCPRFIYGLIATLIVGPHLCLSLLAQGNVLFLTRPERVVLGLSSKADHLREWLPDFSAVTFINQQLPPSARVFFLWNGRNFYCDGRCLPDTDHFRWSRLVRDVGDPETLFSFLRESGVTHLLADWRGADFYTSYDPTKAHVKAIQFLQREFAERYLKAVYEDDNMTVYEVRAETLKR